MRDILAEIVAEKKIEVAEDKKNVPLSILKASIKPGSFAMSKAFREKKWNLIAECKLRSPAKGNLIKSHSVEELATIYEKNGASVLSIHTDKHFLGKKEDIVQVKKIVDLPILRKEFIIDEYQIYEARKLGADAILLIARILSREKLKEFLYLAWSLGMDALVEVHDQEDLEAALATPAQYIGVNNRDLKHFNTDIKNTLELLPYIDRSRTLVSESGIFTGEDASCLRHAGCRGILVGEGLVRAQDIALQTRILSAGEIHTA